MKTWTLRRASAPWVLSLLVPLLVTKASLWLLSGSDARAAESATETSNGTFLEQNPHLRELLFREPVSPFLVGFGVSPLSFLPNRVGLSLSVLQIHYKSEDIDWEIFNGALGLAPGSGTRASRQLTLRTAPKWRVMDKLSLGVLFGYEYVTFSEVQSQVARGIYGTEFASFSTSGPILGLVLSETFPWTKNRWLRVSQTLYRQTYGIQAATADEWGDRFLDPAIEGDPEKEPLKAGLVFQIEFSLLF